jgi:hypothetical protein
MQQRDFPSGDRAVGCPHTLMSPKPAISEIQRALGVGTQSDAEIVELEIKE